MVMKTSAWPFRNQEFETAWNVVRGGDFKMVYRCNKIDKHHEQPTSTLKNITG